MRVATERIARKTVRFSDMGDCVIGVWDNSTPLGNLSLYVTTNESGKFRIGINGADTYMEGDCMESLLDWAFTAATNKANENSPGNYLLSIINDVMYPDIHG